MNYTVKNEIISLIIQEGSNLMRFLFTLLLLYIIYRIGKHLLKSYFKEVQKKSRTVNLVQCDYCKLNIPENEAIKNNRIYYCCEKHQLDSKNTE